MGLVGGTGSGPLGVPRIRVRRRHRPRTRRGELAMAPRGWAYLAAYLLVVLLWVTMATALAVLTRSVAVSVAAPITWMLLIEQLASMVPMLEAITPWLPFNASHMLLAQAL